jgi:hypothetical protein
MFVKGCHNNPNEKLIYNYNDKIVSFMDQLLPIICIHSYDIVTTKKLLCVSKSAFADFKDIWNEKLIYEYQNFIYLYFGHPINISDAFTQDPVTEKPVTQIQVERNKYFSFHNYCLRKINNFCLIYSSLDSRENIMLVLLDDALYEDCNVIHRTILRIADNQKLDSKFTEFIHLDFRNIINRFVILESRDCDEWVFQRSCSSIEDVKYFLNTTKEERDGERNIVEHNYEDLVIDLHGIFPYYVSLKNSYELDESVDESANGKWYFYQTY